MTREARARSDKAENRSIRHRHRIHRSSSTRQSSIHRTAMAPTTYSALTVAINTFNVAKSRAMLADPSVNVNSYWSPVVDGYGGHILNRPPIGVAAMSLHNAIVRATPPNTAPRRRTLRHAAEHCATPPNTAPRDVEWLQSTDAATGIVRKALAIMEAFLRTDRVDVNVKIRNPANHERLVSLVYWAIMTNTHAVSARLLAILLARGDLDLSDRSPMHIDGGSHVIFDLMFNVIGGDVTTCAKLLDNPSIKGSALDSLAIAHLDGFGAFSHAVAAARVAAFMRRHPQYLNRMSDYEYDTPLIHVAADPINVGAMTALLRLQADVTARNIDGYTALTAGVRPTAVKMLLRSKDIDIHARPSVWLGDDADDDDDDADDDDDDMDDEAMHEVGGDSDNMHEVDEHGDYVDGEVYVDDDDMGDYDQDSEYDDEY